MKINRKENRVVITGIGVVSSIGFGKAEFWKNLLDGKSGIGEATFLNASEFRTSVSGQIKDPAFDNFVSTELSAKYGRTSQLGIVGTKLAIKDAKLTDKDLATRAIGIIMGTTNGEAQVLENINEKCLTHEEEKIDYLDILKFPGNIIALNIAKEIKLDAECVVIPTACAAGNYAIGYAFDRIRADELSLAFAGGCDAFSRMGFLGFNSIFALAPEKCQPFDKDRKGIVVGEGAGVLVLESLGHAIDRGATIYAEVLGYALSCDASHMTIPNVDGITMVMKKALNESSVDPNDVGYISAHGTGTLANDKAESTAINRIFSKKNKPIPVSSIKSMLGHTMGAASALEAISCALALHDSKIPPTINYATSDQDCDIDCVPNTMREQNIEIAVNNSFAFGGNNACLVLKKYHKENIQ